MMGSITRTSLKQSLSLIAIAIAGIAGCRDPGQASLPETRAQSTSGISTPGVGGRSTPGTDTGWRNNSYQRTRGNQAANSVRLSWEAPTHRANGEGLYPGEIREYVISYGKSPKRLGFSVTVESDGTAAMEHTLKDLDPGTWYFTVQTVDLSDNVSQKADIVKKSL